MIVPVSKFIFVPGDYSLDIRDVTLDDDGVYRCQVSSGLNGKFILIYNRIAEVIIAMKVNEAKKAPLLEAWHVGNLPISPRNGK